VLKKNPTEARAARIIVDGYVAQNQSAKAGERLGRIVAAHPDSEALLRLQGNWFRSLHKTAEAREAFAAAVAEDKRSVPDPFASAELDEALGSAQRALEAAPENPGIRDTFGWIYYRKGCARRRSTI
jgi:predicted Zn-dependent protease